MKWPIALAFAAATAIVSPAAAQVYPSRPITLVVPYPAGGAFDAIARILTERMKMSLGQPVIIENVGGGATGSIGVGRVARASPDGYTLSFGIWTTHVVNGAVYALPYDVSQGFCADFTCCHGPTGNCLDQCGAGDESARVGRMAQGQSGPSDACYVGIR